jgi:hypothetical protein
MVTVCMARLDKFWLLSNIDFTLRVSHNRLGPTTCTCVLFHRDSSVIDVAKPRAFLPCALATRGSGPVVVGTIGHIVVHAFRWILPKHPTKQTSSHRKLEASGIHWKCGSKLEFLSALSAYEMGDVLPQQRTRREVVQRGLYLPNFRTVSF